MPDLKTIIQSIKSLKKNNQKENDAKFKKTTPSFKVRLNQFVKSFFLISFGILFAGFGLKGFLLPNYFVDGGATGISLLIAELTGYHLSILLIIINLPFFFLGYFQIGKQFAIKCVLSIFGLALVVYFIQYPVITSDKLLIAVFGGIFLGGGIGLSVRGGAVLDGTEVLAIFISKKIGLTIGDIILIFNIIIFAFAAYIINIETALYAILTYFAASKTVDFVIEGIEEYTGITIISDRNESIRTLLIEKLGHGVTVYSGKKGFAKSGESLKETNIIYTVITRLEITRLRNEIEKIDPNAFIIMNSVKDTRGGMIKRRSIK
ncbi:MAG: YitT family protein [Ignavibacteriaceae bacterium]